jgi:carbon-monoxide dehydrogenase small subunit
LQQSIIDCGAVQCGFCTGGLLVVAHALLADNPHPTSDEVRSALSGNLCRCSGYAKIVEAVCRANEGSRP